MDVLGGPSWRMKGRWGVGRVEELQGVKVSVSVGGGKLPSTAAPCPTCITQQHANVTLYLHYNCACPMLPLGSK